MILSPYQAAQQFVAVGFSVIPILPDGSKRPSQEWKPFAERFATTDELQHWYQSTQPFGIGVICGAISGNLEVVDIDQVDLAPQFEQIINTSCPGLLDRIITIKTPRDGGKGRQYWCRLPYSPPGHEDLARGLRPGDDGQDIIKTLIETRSAGNFVVAPGSPVAMLMVYFAPILCWCPGSPYQRKRIGQPRIGQVDLSGLPWPGCCPSVYFREP